VTDLSQTAPFTYREVGLHDRLRESAREVDSKPAVIHGERTMTFAGLDAALVLHLGAGVSVVLVLVLIFRPSGLLGERVADRA